jgi:hypothetical protein
VQPKRIVAFLFAIKSYLSKDCVRVIASSKLSEVYKNSTKSQ